MTLNTIEQLACELNWTFLQAGEVIEFTGSELLIVLAPQWSSPDLGLIRGMRECVPLSVKKVLITDVDFLTGSDAYEKVLPGAPVVMQTPVAALYEKGRLVAIWSGPKQIEAFPQGGLRWPGYRD